MNLNVSWWWMVELIFWQELKLCNDTWHTFDERKSKKKMKRTTFYSLCNYCMTHIMGHISILTAHPEHIFCLYVIASGYAWKQHHYYTQSWPDCLLYSCTLPSSYMSRPALKDRLVTCSDQPESVRGISEACGVFNMEIGFEPHLHRSAHLWAKLCYCWQRKWTINSS